MNDLRAIARALGGEVVAGGVVAPGPGHGSKDRSLSVKLSATAPDGFIAFSHAGDDWHTCKDHVRARLGIARASFALRPAEVRRRPPQPPGDDDRTGPALSLWAGGVDPRGCVAERYLSSRGLDLSEDIAGSVLRWHPGINAMIALFRNIETDEPQAVSRTYIDRDGRKLERKFLGPVGGAAVKLDLDENVLAARRTEVWGGTLRAILRLHGLLGLGLSRTTL